MTTYQVVNEQSYPVYEFNELAEATLKAVMLNDWHESHCFYVKVADIQAN